jgi:hypothetical protein
MSGFNTVGILREVEKGNEITIHFPVITITLRKTKRSENGIIAMVWEANGKKETLLFEESKEVIEWLDSTRNAVKAQLEYVAKQEGSNGQKN